MFVIVTIRFLSLNRDFQANMTPVEYFGEQLRKAGYNYHGTERMYSGITGEEFEV